MIPAFFGKYEHQLDDKNRLRIPARFKKALTDKDGKPSYYFARGKDDCIYVLTEEYLSELLEKLSSERLGNASAASMLFVSSISPAEEDPQGRVVLPASLKEAAGIKKDIVTVGRVTRLEIWEPDRLAQYTKNEEYGSIFTTLGI